MLRGAILVVIMLAGLGALWLLPQFRRDMEAARARLAAEVPDRAYTPCGEIEFAARGKGPAVVAVHGIFGGFDQGLGIAKAVPGMGYRVIAPSRFGYLGTPMPEGATPEAQADAFVCLLDHLDLERAVFFGTSAGATSVLQFALLYPERTAGLILMSANAPGEVEVKPMPRLLAQRIFGSDFLFWLLTTHFQGVLAPIMGVPEGFALTAGQRADLATTMRAILPVRARREGALFDMYVSNPHVNSGYPLETLTTPVLVINARDDPLTLYANAAAMADRIPGARLVTIADGGHMLLGHDDEVQGEIAGFLAEVAGR